MKTTVPIVLFLCFSTVLFADEINYENQRESSSRFINTENESEIKRLYDQTSNFEILKEISKDKSINFCASKFIQSIKNKLYLLDPKEIETAILGLRINDSLDDISTNILLKTNAMTTALPSIIVKNDLNDEEEKRSLEIFRSNLKSLKDDSQCIEDSYRALVKSLIKEMPKFYKNLKHINNIAYKNNLINKKQFKILEVLRANKVYEWPLTLSEYGNTLMSLAKAFPSRSKDSSVLVSKVSIKQKKSLRQNLFERYNSTQIMIMAKIIADLKRRLDSNDVSIIIDYQDHDSEIIALSPMEKFRFMLKLLRRELAQLNNGSLMNGQNANYLDLIAASYEVGKIQSSEIEQLASLQEIWDPSRSPKEKVMFWVRTFGNPASVLLPPPFGFVSMLALMLIDQQISEAPVNHDLDFILF